jgi:Transcriptional regulators
MTGKKTTIKDIAEAVGVSTALVSFALNNNNGKYRVSEEMVKKIRAKAKEFNYQPNSAARSLRSGRTDTIGVLLSDISNRFFADIARCIEDEASKDGITVMIGSTDENPKKFQRLIDVFINKGVDGFIIVPCEGSEKIIKKLIDFKIPVVLIDRTYEDLDVSSVTLNNKKAISLAVKELYSQGYKKIHFVSYYTTTSNIVDREAGYITAMQKFGLESESNVRKIKYVDIYDQLQTLIPQMVAEGTEAIVFCTNRLAIDSLLILRSMGKKVPEDIAIVAFDGSETFAFQLYYTSISYIKQPIDKFGTESYSILMKMIENKDLSDCKNVVLNPELISLNSSKRK